MENVRILDEYIRSYTRFQWIRIKDCSPNPRVSRSNVRALSILHLQLPGTQISGLTNQASPQLAMLRACFKDVLYSLLVNAEGPAVNETHWDEFILYTWSLYRFGGTCHMLVSPLAPVSRQHQRGHGRDSQHKRTHRCRSWSCTCLEY